MKLADKFTLWFLAIVLLITPLSMFNTFNTIRKHIDSSEIDRLKQVNDEVAQKLNQGMDPDQYARGRPISIVRWNAALPKNLVEVRKDKPTNNKTESECRITVTSFYKLNGQNFRISSYNYVLQSSLIQKSMLQSGIIKMLIIVVTVLLTGRILSRKILSPFNQTLKQIQKFNLRKKQPLSLIETNTKEFYTLNQFLKKMTDKAIMEYGLVKEFSENASHELQTPLAVLRSKLELLTETEIKSDQASLIMEMQNAIEKLSRINHSLLLLTKLENQEFESTGLISFSKHIKDILSFYEDRILMKEIQLHTEIADDIQVKINPALADILFGNLLSNAIRHNFKGGKIDIISNSHQLKIRNTGPAPIFKTEELFHRFKKSNQCNNSIGLGLSIVKQICDMHQFPIQYTFENGMHHLVVTYNTHFSSLYAVDHHKSNSIVTS